MASSLKAVAERTCRIFDDGRAVCDGVAGRLGLELRLTWLAGRRIIDRLDRASTIPGQTVRRSGSGWAVNSMEGRPLVSHCFRCEAVSRDTNFYYSFLVLSAAKRRAIVAVWDFCRTVDDAVDAPYVGNQFEAATDPDRLRFELARWRREVKCCFGEDEPQTEQGSAP